MLQLDDAALARFFIAATRVDWRQRRQWLRDLAERIDPPTRRTPAARRQARVRARRKNGEHVYKLVLSDLAVEGIITQLIATETLTEAEALDHRCIETLLARLLEEQGARWAR